VLSISCTLIILSIHYAIVYFFYGTPNRRFWVRNFMVKKMEIAESILTSKIVFTGGSATLFGIRTVDVEAELGVPCVNAGVNAGLQLDYILHYTKAMVRPGDVVICALEYEQFLFDGDADEIKMHYVMTFDMDYFHNLPFFERASMLLGFNPRMMVRSIKERRRFTPGEGPMGPWHIDALNKRGDHILNTRCMPERLKEGGPFRIQVGDFKETRGLKIVEDFYKWCQANGIKFYLTYANTLFFDAYKSERYQVYLKNLQDYFEAKGIPTIGKPDDFFYDRSLFFDTVYHLNEEGAKIRTAEFIKMLKDKQIVDKKEPWREVAEGRSGG
jgi:hypothetical protein